ncbi:unnamed protein product [Fusarium graminearum]|nr:unnamed protein product [Fusarium graminearum]
MRPLILVGDGLGLGLLLLLGLTTFGGLSLDVLVVDSEGLVDLGLESRFVLNAIIHVDKLGVFHLQKHTSDLAGKVGVDGLDLGEDQLTQNLLLLRGRGGSKLLLETGESGSIGTTATLRSVAVAARSTSATLAVVVRGEAGHVTSHGRHARHTLRTTTAALRSATAAKSSLLSLHSSHELRSAGLAVSRRELARHTVHVGGHLLGNTTTSTLLRVGELSRTALGHSHATLGEGNATTTLRHEAGLLARSEVDRGLHVLLGHTGVGDSLLHTDLVASLDTSLKLALADILALGQSDVQRLAVEHALVNTLVLVGLLQAGSFIRLAELLLALVLLLGSANVEVLAVEILVVKLVNSLGGTLVGGEVDKAEATALALLVTSQRGRSDIAVLLEELAEIILGNVSGNVLDVDVGEVGLHLLKLALAVLLGNVVADVNLLLVEKHTVNVLDGLGSGLISLIVNETIALGGTSLVLGNLAAQDVTESSKGVVESLVVDGNIEVLDENVTLASLAKGRITLGPHDTAGAALDDGVVELLKSLLAIRSGIVVDVGIAERATGDGITADTNGSNSTNLGEKLEQHSLGDGGVKLANVEGSRVLGVRSSGGGGRSGSIVSGSSDTSVDGRGIGLASVERGVVEVVGELVNSAGSSVGGHCEYRFLGLWKNL